MVGLLDALVAVYVLTNPALVVGLSWTTPLSCALVLFGVLAGAKAMWAHPRGVIWVIVLGALATLLIALVSIPFRTLSPGEYRIEVRKAQRTLTLFHQDRKVGEYPIALGPNPEGDKQREGDCRTPEGTFIITDRSYEPFHRWLGISYPDARRVARGRLEGRLTWPEFWYARFKAINGMTSFGRTQLGGSVGIHGGGSRTDWTLGCIALNNADVEELHSKVHPGTPVSILP